MNHVQPFKTQPLKTLWTIDDWCHRHLHSAFWHFRFNPRDLLCRFVDFKLWRETDRDVSLP